MTATTQERTASALPRLKQRYRDEIAGQLREQFGYANVMQTPSLTKVVVNMGVGDAARDSKLIDGAVREINERLSKDLKPEENAVVWLVHVFGESSFDGDLADTSLEMLGIDRMSTQVPEFIALETYAGSLKSVAPNRVRQEAMEIQAELFIGSERTWAAEELPRLDKYLRANDAALDVIVAASHLPRYYFPMLSEEEPQRLMSASLAIERRLPFLSRTLSARALQRIGQGDFAAAEPDLIACHRLAWLLGNLGLTDLLADLVPSGHGLGSLLLVAAGAALLSNLVNNIPATLLLLPAVAPAGEGALLAMLVGVGIGPNLAYPGSIANLLWRREMIRGRAAIPWPEFTRIGLVTVPVGILVATTLLWAALRI